MKVSTLFLCIALFLTTGCDSSDPEDQNPTTGSFTLTVSGDVNKTVSSNLATFGTGLGPSAGDAAFGLNFGSATDVFSFARISGQPGTGTFNVQDVLNTNEDDWLSDEFGATYLDDTAGLYASVSGSITITRSEDNVMEGTFSVSLENFDTNDPSSIAITGEFVAIGLTFNPGG